MSKTKTNILIGLSANVALAWGYIELNTAALHLGAQHHDAKCQHLHHAGVEPQVR